MLIQAALNGGRTRQDHPAVPLTPEELAEEARQSVEAGAHALHFHPRNSTGEQTLDPEPVGAAIAAVRAACPDTPLGVTTGSWIVPGLSERQALVRVWTVLPDYVSVNAHETGAIELIATCLDLGMDVEVGINSPESAETWAASGLASRCLRPLVEPPEADFPSALAKAEGILEVLARHAIDRPVLLHGMEGAAWPMIGEAARRGYDTRIGLEDVLVLPDGSRAKGNGELVRAVVERR